MGFKDKDGELCFQAVQTISYLNPVFYFMENVLSLADCDDGSESDLGPIVQDLGARLPNHHHLLLQGLDPSRQGYPTHKPRLALIGGRKDQVNDKRMTQAYQTLAECPVPVAHSFRNFLGMQAAAPCDWDRVGCPPSADELVLIAGSGCTCSLDPMVLCSLHVCKCGKCGQTGLDCSWREKARTYLAGIFDADAPVPFEGRLTYVQVLELAGRTGPTSARERNMLNAFGVTPSLKPLKSTLAIMNISQSIHRIVARKSFAS